MSFHVPHLLCELSRVLVCPEGVALKCYVLEVFILKKSSSRVHGYPVVWPEEQSQLDQEGKSPGKEE